MASTDTVNMETSSESTPTASTASASDSTSDIASRPIALIVLGMAGSGKTSFVKRLTQLSHVQNMKPYVVNLDPACAEVPYHANIGKCV